jgi:hypothetical protein
MSRLDTRPLTMLARIDAAVAPLPPDAREQLRDRLERLRRDCGCHSGLALTLFVAAAWIIHLAADGISVISWSAAGGIGWVFAAALCGKLLGLLWARIRLIRALADLERHPSGSTA